MGLVKWTQRIRRGAKVSDYIMDLRKVVGNRHLLQCGASVIAINEKGEILLQKRGDDGNWGYCGGSVELLERVEDAAKREFFEETGLTAHKLELFGVFSGVNMHHIYPNGDEVSNVDIVFLCREFSGELTIDGDEVLDLAWFLPDQLPEAIAPMNVEPLEAYLKILS